MKHRPDARGHETKDPEELGSCPGSAVSRPWVWGRAPCCELHPSSVVAERLLDMSSKAPPALMVLLSISEYYTGVGRLSLLQGIFLTQGSNPGLLHCRWSLYKLSKVVDRC